MQLFLQFIFIDWVHKVGAGMTLCFGLVDGKLIIWASRSRNKILYLQLLQYVHLDITKIGVHFITKLLTTEDIYGIIELMGKPEMLSLFGSDSSLVPRQLQPWG